MFYSHEILASPKYGVATVWLVANLGHNTSNRRLTRKLIEGVNVPQACDTIEKPPGAPIALRLQGSLLYGVSGVYSKHGGYLLDDTLKMWARMRTYFREQGATKSIDPNAGKAKRAQLILVDDPNFVPEFDLPAFSLDENGDLVLPGFEFSQLTKASSQLSPMNNSSGSAANLPFVDLNIRHSSSQAGSVHLNSPFEKPAHQQDDDSMVVFGEEEDLPWDDFPIRIDADGNLIEEPELPLHPPQMEENPFGELAGPAQKVPSEAHLPNDDAPMIFGDNDGQIMFGDDEHSQQQPPAEFVDPAQQNIELNKDVPLPSEEELSSDLGDVPQHKRRQRKIKILEFDPATHISRAELRGWMDSYTARIEESQHGPAYVTTTQAKRNAYILVFGMGLGDIGAMNTVPDVEHELGEFFAGENLKDMLMGEMLAGAEEEGGEEDQAEGARGAARRRSASIAFGLDDDQNQDERRVRPRADGDAEEQDQELTRSQQDARSVNDGIVAFDSDPADMNPEIGREHPGSALSDHRRSSNAPWNRHSSVEVGRNAVEDSPMVGRGSILQNSNAKFSDNDVPAFGSEGFAPLQFDGAGHDLSSLANFGAAAGVSTQEADTSQFMRRALDREGRNFLGFVEQVAARRGDEDEHVEDLRWVEFDGLFEKEDKTRTVVAQAFLHVLSLATKGQIKVKQEGVEEHEAFGEIRVGVTAAVHEEYHSAEEELSDEDIAEGKDIAEGEQMEGVEFQEVEQEMQQAP